MSKILLFHGAWHNGKCWDKVSAILTKNGYEAEAMTLPGNGENDSKEVSYDDYVNYACEKIGEQKEKVIIVCHSSAGHIIQMAVPKVADKVKKVIFNNAWIMPDGKSQFDYVPDEIKNGMRQAAAASGTGAIPIDPGFVRGLLASEARDEVYEELMSILVEQPLIIMETPIQAKEFAALDIPKVLLYNNKDVSVAPGAFVGMFKAFGDNPVIEAECDHEGLFTNPEVYTEALMKAIQL
jgi:pimeloyl-ACP methyl ester carboxylesterase